MVWREITGRGRRVKLCGGTLRPRATAHGWVPDLWPSIEHVHRSDAFAGRDDLVNAVENLV